MPNWNNDDQKRNNGQRESRYLRDDNTREFNSDGDFQDFGDAVYGNHAKSSRNARPSRAEQEQPFYGDEPSMAARYWHGRDPSPGNANFRHANRLRHENHDYAFGQGEGQGYRLDDSENYRRGPGLRMSKRNPFMRDTISAYTPYGDADAPYFSGGQLNQNAMPGTQRMDHGYDPDYMNWRDSELNRHDTAYSDWRRAQAQNYDKAYGEWRKTRQDKFAQDFDVWRNAQSSSGQSTPAANAPGGDTDETPSK